MGSKLVYGAGSVAYGVKDNGFSTSMMLYFDQISGLPAIYIALALLLAVAFDAVSDPSVGRLSTSHISVRWNSRFGRRHPFMYVAMLPATLAYFWLWNPPADLGQSGLFAYLLVMAVLVQLLITLFEVPNSAMIAELDKSYDGRTRLAGLRSMMGWVGGIVMAIIAYEVYLRPIGDACLMIFARYLRRYLHSGNTFADNA